MIKGIAGPMSPQSGDEPGPVQQEDQAIEIGVRHALWSQVLDEERPYWVYLPPSYHDTTYPSQRYPVLYLLDGEYHFHAASGVVHQMSASYQLPELIVPAVLGNPSAMRVGDEAYAVGNPFGLHSSMSSGVISGFDRSFKPQESDQMLHGLIQIDAAVNPGNSGGPLLNRNGQVIGIVTGIINPTEKNFFVGVGFAVPIGVAVTGIGSPPY